MPAGRLEKDIVQAQMEIVNQVSSAWKSQVLFVLLKFDIFNYLENNPSDAARIAGALNLPYDSLKRLLDCGAAVGYLKKNDMLYENTEMIKSVLVKGKPGYMGNWVLLASRWYASFGKLEDAVKMNTNVEDINFNRDDAYKDVYIKGMIDYPAYRGSEIINIVDFDNKKYLLDVGCGPGIYITLFCKKYPHLRCAGYDLPHALEIAKEYVKREGVEKQVEFIEGDYLAEQSFGSEFDVVFLSHILHQLDESNCRKLLGKCYRALKSKGQIIVQAMFLNDNSIGPFYAALHDLLALLIFPRGRNYSAQETIELLEKAGFIKPFLKKMSLFNVNSLVIAEKPDKDSHV